MPKLFFGRSLGTGQGTLYTERGSTLTSRLGAALTGATTQLSTVGGGTYVAAAAEQPTAASAVDTASVSVRIRASQMWAMLIERMYEIDPLTCPRCSGQMKVVAFIAPPQGDVIEKKTQRPPGPLLSF